MVLIALIIALSPQPQEARPSKPRITWDRPRLRMHVSPGQSDLLKYRSDVDRDRFVENGSAITMSVPTSLSEGEARAECRIKKNRTGFERCRIYEAYGDLSREEALKILRRARISPDGAATDWSTASIEIKVNPLDGTRAKECRMLFLCGVPTPPPPAPPPGITPKSN